MPFKFARVHNLKMAEFTSRLVRLLKDYRDTNYFVAGKAM